jgi:hypothetical protein
LIRFIDLGKQIAQDKDDPDWPREFCFYDTLEARFLAFDGQEVFDSREDLLEQIGDHEASYIRRVMNLLPAWVPRKDTTTR